MVSAVNELVEAGSPRKLVVLAECGLWTIALGLAAALLGWRFQASPAYAASLTTVLGGLLLGLGAWLNGACVFGSIARIGGRDWHYLLTPPGYFAGSLLHAYTVGGFAHAVARPVSSLPVVVLLILLALSLLATAGRWRALRGQGHGPAALWDYRHATIAIGVAFVMLAVLAGPWTYTEALGKLAHGGGLPDLSTIVLLAALLGGAILGGRQTAGRKVFSAHRAGLCVAGGALMGFGGSLIPGGNDNLILVGLPGLQPHAWLAIAAMIAGIAAGLYGSQVASRLRLASAASRSGTV
jgi:toxin CptA